MAFFGYKVQNYKGVVFALAGMIAGLSGGLYAFHEGYVGPGQLGPVLSTQVVLYVLFGGVGTLVGGIGRRGHHRSVQLPPFAKMGDRLADRAGAAAAGGDYVSSHRPDRLFRVGARAGGVFRQARRGRKCETSRRHASEAPIP